MHLLTNGLHVDNHQAFAAMMEGATIKHVRFDSNSIMHKILATTVAFFALAASASAYTTTTDPAPASWASYLTQAAEYWQATPDCPHGVEMYMMHDDNPNVGARGVQPGCIIYINDIQVDRGLAWGQCKLIVHEFGHLLGHDHAEGGIMAPDASIYDVPVPGCDALKPAEIAAVSEPVPVPATPVVAKPKAKPKVVTGASAIKSTVKVLGPFLTQGDPVTLVRGCKTVKGRTTCSVVIRSTDTRCTAKGNAEFREGDWMFWLSRTTCLPTHK